MQIHNLKRNKSLRAKRYVGRGGKRGTTAGRGTKGQKARAGHKIRPEIRDIIKKLPKRRGYRFGSIYDKDIPVNLFDLEKAFDSNDTVSPEILVEKKLVRKKGKNIPLIKILGTGVLTKKLTIIGCKVSLAAKEKIAKVGGIIQE
ncbi:MAG: uL15 family ribosomal protein [Patescibacteria group bacterium]